MTNSGTEDEEDCLGPGSVTPGESELLLSYTLTLDIPPVADSVGQTAFDDNLLLQLTSGGSGLNSF